MCFFFFQAEDGIRDYKVTGVQTCALPIYRIGRRGVDDGIRAHHPRKFAPRAHRERKSGVEGKRGEIGGRRIIKKKKKKEKQKRKPERYETRSDVAVRLTVVGR